jgi:NADH-quinone oxidoreductase subunit H
MKSLGIILPLLISVAFVTLAERKILGSIQIRKGPNTVGLIGIMQPLADGLKLFVKECLIPTHSNSIVFIIAPILGLSMALISWAVVPLGLGMAVVDWSLGILFIMAVSSISIYSMIMSGWSSNSQYSFLGAIRASAQMISYEVSLGLIILVVVISAGELNLTSIVISQEEIWYIIPQLPAFVMFFVSSLAETNRSPFDLTEGESELVSGYNTEYSGMAFALFFLSEYSHIIVMSTLISILFLGGWLPLFGIFLPFPWLGVKIVIVIYFFIWVRGSYPRVRYDQLMLLLWKSYLPLSLGWLVIASSIILSLIA